MNMIIAGIKIKIPNNTKGLKEQIYFIEKDISHCEKINI